MLPSVVLVQPVVLALVVPSVLALLLPSVLASLMSSAASCGSTARATKKSALVIASALALAALVMARASQLLDLRR